AGRLDDVDRRVVPRIVVGVVPPERLHERLAQRRIAGSVPLPGTGIAIIRRGHSRKLSAPRNRGNGRWEGRRKRKEERGKRKEEGGRRKEEGGRRKEEDTLGRRPRSNDHGSGFVILV